MAGSADDHAPRACISGVSSIWGPALVFVAMAETATVWGKGSSKRFWAGVQARTPYLCIPPATVFRDEGSSSSKKAIAMLPINICTSRWTQISGMCSVARANWLSWTMKSVPVPRFVTLSTRIAHNRLRGSILSPSRISAENGARTVFRAVGPAGPVCGCPAPRLRLPVCGRGLRGTPRQRLGQRREPGFVADRLGRFGIVGGFTFQPMTSAGAADSNPRPHFAWHREFMPLLSDRSGARGWPDVAAGYDPFADFAWCGYRPAHGFRQLRRRHPQYLYNVNPTIMPYHRCHETPPDGLADLLRQLGPVSLPYRYSEPAGLSCS